jgi:hypothetical protein
MTVQSVPAMLVETKPAVPLDQFLSPLSVNSDKLHALARGLETTFRELAADSDVQFLPTPISSTLLAPIGELGKLGGARTRYA